MFQARKKTVSLLATSKHCSPSCLQSTAEQVPTSRQTDRCPAKLQRVSKTQKRIDLDMHARAVLGQNIWGPAPPPPTSSILWYNPSNDIKVRTTNKQNKHPFNGPLQETASGSGISWAICKSAPRSRQITTPATHHSVFTGRMHFLPPNQQRQSNEGTKNKK